MPLSERRAEGGSRQSCAWHRRAPASAGHTHACRLFRRDALGVASCPGPLTVFTCYKWSYKGVRPPARCHLPPELYTFQTPPKREAAPLREVKVETALADQALWCVSSTHHLSDSRALPVWLCLGAASGGLQFSSPSGFSYSPRHQETVSLTLEHFP